MLLLAPFGRSAAINIHNNQSMFVDVLINLHIPRKEICKADTATV